MFRALTLNADYAKFSMVCVTSTKYYKIHLQICIPYARVYTIGSILFTKFSMHTVTDIVKIINISEGCSFFFFVGDLCSAVKRRKQNSSR